jgi:hypothetical protein
MVRGIVEVVFFFIHQVLIAGDWRPQPAALVSVFVGTGEQNFMNQRSTVE